MVSTVNKNKFNYSTIGEDTLQLILGSLSRTINLPFPLDTRLSNNVYLSGRIRQLHPCFFEARNRPTAARNYLQPPMHPDHH